MIIVNEFGDEVYLFNSIEEVECNLEAIDIENNEYEACDDEGFIYKFKLIEPPGTLKSGRFKIIKTNEKDINLPKSYFINYGKKFFKTKEELESIYKSSSCASDAIKKLKSKNIEG